MTVIAMTQEMGSLAKDVALELANTMNLSVLRKEVVEHVAGKMHVRSSLINRLREGKAGLLERLTTDKERVALFSAEERGIRAGQPGKRGNSRLGGYLPVASDSEHPVHQDRSPLPKKGRMAHGFPGDRRS